MLDIPIPEIGSKGVFTEELEQELAFGKIDLAVHSAKDMPSELPSEFEIIAYTAREQAHDVLVSYQNNLELDGSIIIGTSSSRSWRRISSTSKLRYSFFSTIDLLSFSDICSPYIS